MNAPCRAGVDVPTVEVRADGLSVDSSVYVGSRAMPTLTNAYRNFIEVTGVPTRLSILCSTFHACI